MRKYIFGRFEFQREHNLCSRRVITMLVLETAVENHKTKKRCNNTIYR
jgi:hypothetical protein